ncbi:DUF6894 family protein [Methylobacterium brachythecii]|uniref:DUF6894 domain-containing protein n=1 Tax=Methylobacterium brachythecii TaxID=1176177 RepID=A0A7W6ALH7_9HYPH|nr:hypothetical protein [Methylobacterium brachythecii]MBB3905648.1 hypothetical protein [Methylobacterium brachythecii]GLS46904.1 hypothetical protein GCM10007884_49020 [Methylobacterium brachythecii]
MPARFHFDVVRDDEVIRDEDGVEAEDLDDATEQALLCIEEMTSTGELSDGDGWCLVIRDETGDERRRIAI